MTPVSGITRVTPPTITNTCRANTEVRPTAISLENESEESIAVLNPRHTNSRYPIRIPMAPNRPTSEVMTA